MRIPFTPIAVDDFSFQSGVFVYLLSHFHADHTKGLSPSWANGIIYCTEITRALVLDKYDINPSLVVGLSLGQRHEISIDLVGNVTIQLELLEANHCFGACMFWLRGYFGTVVHTGDFRFDPILWNYSVLQPDTIDELYLDDTFLEPQFRFPPRNIAGEQILSILGRLDDTVEVLVKTDTFGKEELLIKIAEKMHSLVSVSAERLHLLQLLEPFMPTISNLFTTDEDSARIHVVTKPYLVSEGRLAFLNRTARKPTVAIIPTGWSNLESTSAIDFTATRHHIGYSLHSSFPELEQFVSVLRPKQIYSTSRKDQANLVLHFGKYFDQQSAPRSHQARASTIPHSVVVSMIGRRHNPHQSSTSPVPINHFCRQNMAGLLFPDARNPNGGGLATTAASSSSSSATFRPVPRGAVYTGSHRSHKRTEGKRQKTEHSSKAVYDLDSLPRDSSIVVVEDSPIMPTKKTRLRKQNHLPEEIETEIVVIGSGDDEDDNHASETPHRLHGRFKARHKTDVGVGCPDSNGSPGLSFEATMDLLLTLGAFDAVAYCSQRNGQSSATKTVAKQKEERPTEQPSDLSRSATPTSTKSEGPSSAEAIQNQGFDDAHTLDCLLELQSLLESVSSSLSQPRPLAITEPQADVVRDTNALATSQEPQEVARKICLDDCENSVNVVQTNALPQGCEEGEEQLAAQPGDVVWFDEDISFGQQEQGTPKLANADTGNVFTGLNHVDDSECESLPLWIPGVEPHVDSCVAAEPIMPVQRPIDRVGQESECSPKSCHNPAVSSCNPVRESSCSPTRTTFFVPCHSSLGLGPHPQKDFSGSSETAANTSPTRNKRKRTSIDDTDFNSSLMPSPIGSPDLLADSTDRTPPRLRPTKTRVSSSCDGLALSYPHSFGSDSLLASHPQHLVVTPK